ncbi:acyl-CoA thioesterase [Stenotrophobium rhamnosiphilum]|uniref:Thioesterase n=1 Tax=Stenotrophobium rhamnosiphilum TaxID=2029166 RepID=A0A2T5MEY2_9GAMM|nr:thioesterase family protein [Stenotrophobium rhamnosiphilum]PTU31145.1 thioesterase [Stenotrophobium rhamnosiphilum]
MENIQLSDFGHVVRIPTRWSDLDALGHVNNTKFFTFDEDVRLSYFKEQMDKPSFWKEQGIILANISADFISQLHHPADLQAGFRVISIGRSSLKTLAGIFNGDKLVAVTRGTIVWFDYVNQKSMAVPEDVRQWIRAREKIAPAEG